MNKDVNCPYCGFSQDINHDDGYGFDESKVYEQECESCKKNFAFRTSMVFHYDVNTAACLNGGEHRMRRMYSTRYPNDMRCSRCGKEEMGELDRMEEK